MLVNVLMTTKSFFCTSIRAGWPYVLLCQCKCIKIFYLKGSEPICPQQSHFFYSEVGMLQRIQLLSWMTLQTAQSQVHLGNLSSSTVLRRLELM